MHLFGLPIELLAFIVSFLEHECDLYVFSQADKRLYQLFNCAVYTLGVNGKLSLSSALEWAAEHRNEATARRAFEAGSSLYPKYNEGGYSPMALVTMDGNEDLVRLFLEKVDPNDESYWERTKEPVFLVTEKLYKSIVQMLLDHGAAVYKYNPSSETTNTPLEITVRYGAYLDTIKLLSKAHDYEQFRNDVGRTALSVAAARGYTSAVEYFFDRGLDPEDYHIGEAAEDGHLETLRLFFSNGFLFGHGWLASLLRPLILAACNKHYAVAELLASTGSKIVIQSKYTSTLSTLLGVAAFCGWEDTVRKYTTKIRIVT